MSLTMDEDQEGPPESVEPGESTPPPNELDLLEYDIEVPPEAEPAALVESLQAPTFTVATGDAEAEVVIFESGAVLAPGETERAWTELDPEILLKAAEEADLPVSKVQSSTGGTP